MSKTKLTLSIDRELLAQAKQLAAERGASLSGWVESFFSHLLAQAEKPAQDPWINRMDLLLANMWTHRPDQTSIDQEIKRDHDDFEQTLIDDRSRDFLP